jgi:ribosomal protein S18 acetylase RimI-like enzyme
MSLVGIAVASSARRKKVGLGLMQAFEAKARELQMRSLRLTVDLNNDGAQRLYESLGWQPFHHRIPGKQWVYYFRILSEKSD